MTRKTEEILVTEFANLENSFREMASKGVISRDDLKGEIMPSIRSLKNSCLPLLADDSSFANFLEAQRREIADEFMSDWTFPGQFEASSGWTVSGDEWVAKVFLTRDGEDLSKAHEVRLKFAENSFDLVETSAPEAYDAEDKMDASM